MRLGRRCRLGDCRDVGSIRHARTRGLQRFRLPLARPSAVKERQAFKMRDSCGAFDDVVDGPLFVKLLSILEAGKGDTGVMRL